MTHPRNDPRNRPDSRYHTYFDPLCAFCDAPLPYPNWGDDSAGMLRLGWTRDHDGAWVCPREHTLNFPNGSSITFGPAGTNDLKGMTFGYIGIELAALGLMPIEGVSLEEFKKRYTVDATVDAPEPPDTGGSDSTP